MKPPRVSKPILIALVYLVFVPLFLQSQSISTLVGDIAANGGANNSNVTRRPFTERECIMCKFSVGLVNYALNTRRGADRVHRIANSFCTIAHIESPIVCSQVTKLFNHEIMKVLTYGLVTPEQVCGYLSNNTCGTFHNPMGDWEVNLNASINLNQEEIAKMHRNQARQASEPPERPYRVVHISDTHVDLNYKENTAAVCDEPLCCRAVSRPANGSQAKSGYWGTYADCDIPERTFESTLRAINATLRSADDIDYIIWTGDIQPHDVWTQNKRSALLTYDAVFAKIFEHLPNVKIFPTFGNHEMVPVDSFSPSNLLSIARDDSPEWLYKKLDSFWSRWLPEETIATITKDGFYATTVKPGLKLVSLNTNFCHNKNFWLYINSTDPGDQLKWLIHELQMSEFEREKVHIIGHIPPGVEDCLKVWSRNYNRIIRRFAKTVSGQYFGHTHNSEFEIFYDQNHKDFYDNPESPDWTPISVGFIGSSVTTFIGLNPSFRLYTVDPAMGFQTKDFETFYMNLTAANIAADTSQPEWFSAGKFTELFDIQDVSASSLHSLLLDIVKDLSIDDLDISQATSLSQLISKAQVRSSKSRVYKLYRLFNSYSDYYDLKRFENQSSVDLKEFICRFFTGQAHDPSACNKFVYTTSSKYEKLRRIGLLGNRRVQPS